MKNKIEINRHFKSAKAFYEYCEKMCAKKGMDLHDWIESFDQFESPFMKLNVRTNDDVCVIQPYKWHLFLKGSYNFNMEFDFYTKTEGFGYLYISE